MLCQVKVKTKNIITLTTLICLGGFTYAQMPEFRITDQGQYEYLGNRYSANSVFDETQGTYYKPITARTFFLQALQRGYIQNDITYDSFLLLSLDEQKALLKSQKPLDCSIGQIISEACIVYQGTDESKGGKSDKEPSGKNMGNNRGNLNESVQIILHEK